MGTNMYPSSSLLGQDKDASIAALPIDELIEKADGFAGVFPGVFSCKMSSSICGILEIIKIYVLLRTLLIIKMICWHHLCFSF